MVNLLNRKRTYVALFLIITALLAVFVRDNIDYLKRLRDINPMMLVLIVALCLLNRFLVGLKIKAVMDAFSVKLSFKEWYGMAVISNFYNYIISKSGTFFVATYVKKNHDFNYSKYLSLLMGDMVVILLASGMVGFFSSLYGAMKGLLASHIVIGLFAFLSALAVFFMALPEIKLPEKGILIRVNKVLEGWTMLRKNTALVAKVFVIYVAIMLTFGVRYYIIFRLFSNAIPVFVCFLAAPLNFLTQIVSLVPGAYGVKEVVTGLATKVTDFGFTSGAMAALVDRVIIMSLAFVQGSIFSYFLVRKTGLKIKEGS